MIASRFICRIKGMMNGMLKTILKWTVLVIAAGIFGIFAGCQSPNVGTDTITETELTKPQRFDIIQPDDTLEITLILPSTGTTGPTTQPTEYKVKSDGTINLYLIGDIMAAGKTPKQLETDIFNAYVPKYYKRATISVKQTSRFFYVDGQVKMAGRFPHIGEITLTGAIAAAAGFNDYANKKAVRIIRSDGRIITVDYNKAIKDPKLDLPIYPGDRIIVPRRWM